MTLNSHFIANFMHHPDYILSFNRRIVDTFIAQFNYFVNTQLVSMENNANEFPLRKKQTFSL